MSGWVFFFGGLLLCGQFEDLLQAYEVIRLHIIEDGLYVFRLDRQDLASNSNSDSGYLDHSWSQCTRIV